MITRKQLDIIAKIVTYLYHDERKHYEETASEERKNHIYRDIKSIDQWLSSQYRRLGVKDAEKRKIKQS